MAGKADDLAADLRRRIERGEYPPESRLPGYRDLERTHGVGTNVIRRALAALEAEGLIEIVKKRGIMVRPRAERRRVRRGTNVMRNATAGYLFPAVKNEGEQWAPHGRPQRSRAPIPADVAELLGVEPGSEQLRRRRVMSPAGESPWSIADTWIHPAAVEEAPVVAEPSTGPGGYLDRLEEAGHGPISWTERTRTRMPTGEEARLLGMPRTGMPVLQLARVGWSARTGEPLEVTTTLIPADRVELWTDLQRAESAAWPVEPVSGV